MQWFQHSALHVECLKPVAAAVCSEGIPRQIAATTLQRVTWGAGRQALTPVRARRKALWVLDGHCWQQQCCASRLCGSAATHIYGPLLIINAECNAHRKQATYACCLDNAACCLDDIRIHTSLYAPDAHSNGDLDHPTAHSCSSA